MDFKTLYSHIVTEGEYTYFEKKGSGPLIVCLHGLFGEMENFFSFIHEFSKFSDYHIIIPKLPLYRMSVINSNVKKLSIFLSKFLEHKGVTKCNLLGNSLGGHVALHYINSFPNSVDKLILAGSSGLYEKPIGTSFPKRRDKEFLRKKIEITFYDKNMVTDELIDKCMDLLEDRMVVLRVIRLARSAIRENMTEQVKTIQHNTCLIWGNQDNITPPHVGEEFKNLIHTSELFFIDKCGHAPMLERPIEFSQILHKWMVNNA